jgi:hypothetical protein
VAALSVRPGVFIVTWNVITVSLRRRMLPDHLFGRVNSVYRFIGWRSIPVRAILGGIPAWSRITPAEMAAAEAR